MASLRTTAEGYLLAIEAEAITLDEVSRWVDSLMTTLEDPPPAVVEACCASGDSNKLMSELRRFPGELDVNAACRQMFFHMRRALDADPASMSKIVTALRGFALDNRDVPDKETAEFMRSLERELGRADSGAAAQLRARLTELLREQGVAPT
jgi:hypothetical protein